MNQSQSTNKPFTRHQKIMQCLTHCFNDCVVVNNVSQSQTMETLNKLKSINNDYVNFLKNAYNSMPIIENNDYKSFYDNGLVNYYFNESNANTHLLPYYLKCGVYGRDFYTSIFDHTFDTAVSSAANSIRATQLLNEADVVYCANIFPGHHSDNSSYSGYCFLNNAAICAELLQTNNKVVILDLDFHHGNGTQKIFYNNSNVLTISIHADPITCFPFYTGYLNENNNANINYILSVDATITHYIRVLSDALNEIMKFNAQVLIIAFGADTFENDPQGGFKIQLHDFHTIGNCIFSSVKIPVVVVQEGGYDMDNIDAIVLNFINGLLGNNAATNVYKDNYKY